MIAKKRIIIAVLISAAAGTITSIVCHVIGLGWMVTAASCFTIGFMVVFAMLTLPKRPKYLDHPNTDFYCKCGYGTNSLESLMWHRSECKLNKK